MKRNKDKYFELHAEEDALRLAEEMAELERSFVGRSETHPPKEGGTKHIENDDRGSKK